MHVFFCPRSDARPILLGGSGRCPHLEILPRAGRGDAGDDHTVVGAAQPAGRACALARALRDLHTQAHAVKVVPGRVTPILVSPKQP